MNRESCRSRREVVLGLGGITATTGCLQLNEQDPDEETTDDPPATETADDQSSDDEDEAIESGNIDGEIERVWSVNHQTDAFRRQLELDQSLIACSPRGSVTRLRYSDGDIEWRQEFNFETGSTERVDSYPTLTGNQALIGGPSQIHSIDTETGEIQWQTEIAAQHSLRDIKTSSVETRIEVADQTAVCGYSYEIEGEEDPSSGLFGLELESGEIKWSKTHDEIESEFDAWLSLLALSPPIDGYLIVNGFNENFWINITTGEILTSSSAIARYDFDKEGDALYSSLGGHLRKYEGSVGEMEQAWTFEPLGRPIARPTVDEGIVYFPSDDTGVYAVTDGEEKWRFQSTEEISIPVSVGASGVWAVQESLFWIDKDSGHGIKMNIDLNPYEIIESEGHCIITGRSQTTAYRKREA